jgi:hypothetical protein
MCRLPAAFKRLMYYIDFVHLMQVLFMKNLHAFQFSKPVNK